MEETIIIWWQSGSGYVRVRVMVGLWLRLGGGRTIVHGNEHEHLNIFNNNKRTGWPLTMLCRQL